MTSPVRSEAMDGSQDGLPNRVIRVNTVRDTAAGLMLVFAVLLPWNIYVGLGISGAPVWIMVLIGVVTIASLASIFVSHLGPLRFGTNTETSRLDRLRLLLNVPYFVVVFGFLAAAVVQDIRFGGTLSVPPGLGPGTWFGLAGALLAGKSLITSQIADDQPRTDPACRVVVVASLVLAVYAMGSTLYYRTRFVLPNITDSETSVQNAVVIAAAVLYGAVALIPIVISARWMLSANPDGRLATALLAISALFAGFVVGILPVGRDIDAFHGIAQSTSTTGVGFEGYLAWVAFAAIWGSPVLLTALGSRRSRLWREAVRRILFLIAACCSGSAALRIIDLVTVAALGLPVQPYSGTALMALDLIAAVLAIWLLVNSSGAVTNGALLTFLCGVLSVLTLCRVLLGVALVPRSEPLNPSAITDVYGNTLAQQITSTFDVALAAMAIMLFVIALQNGGRETLRETPAQSGARAGTAEFAVARDRQEASAPQLDSPIDRVAGILAQSTRRFEAGTTYTGAANLPRQDNSTLDKQSARGDGGD